MSSILHRFYVGDALKTLQSLPSESVQCCVTSPPYWGLRDYGVGGQLGLEQTPEEYVANMVKVFSEVKRVLRPDGTLWLNLGDSFASNTKGSGGHNPKQDSNKGSWTGIIKLDHGIKPKDLVGIPWRVAFALQADGWWLRSDIIWAKPNPMPESVTDRPTRAHEFIFLLSKSEKYYYDHIAIHEEAVSERGSGNDFVRPEQISKGEGSRQKWEPSRPPTSTTFKRENSKRKQPIPGQAHGTHRPERGDRWPTGTRNKRDVWTVATQPFPEAHFAVFPPALIEPCILAGSRPGDIVLDPFGGSGTVAMVAKELSRASIYIDLNPEYADMAIRRCGFEQQGLFEQHRYTKERSA